MKLTGKIIIKNSKHKYSVTNNEQYLIPTKLSNRVVVDNYYTCVVCDKKKEVVEIIGI